jgi:hypothetical protein
MVQVFEATRQEEEITGNVLEKGRLFAPIMN